MRPAPCRAQHPPSHDKETTVSISLGKSLQALLCAGVLALAGQAHAQATRT